MKQYAVIWLLLAAVAQSFGQFINVNARLPDVGLFGRQPDGFPSLLRGPHSGLGLNVNLPPLFGQGPMSFGARLPYLNAPPPQSLLPPLLHPQKCPKGFVFSSGHCGPRLVPLFQSLPGEECARGEECTGGSVCTRGVCICPPELEHVNEVCVLPPPPPMPLPSLQVPPFLPQSPYNFPRPLLPPPIGYPYLRRAFNSIIKK